MDANIWRKGSDVLNNHCDCLIADRMKLPLNIINVTKEMAIIHFLGNGTKCMTYLWNQLGTIKFH